MFQHARYDGPLAGTEVGMDLFYTDLLAKLWALDFEVSAPTKQIEDFQPLLKIDYSPIYWMEIRGALKHPPLVRSSGRRVSEDRYRNSVRT